MAFWPPSVTQAAPSGPADHAVRRRALAEFDHADGAVAGVEAVQGAVALAAEPERAVAGGGHVARADAAGGAGRLGVEPGHAIARRRGRGSGRAGPDGGRQGRGPEGQQITTLHACSPRLPGQDVAAGRMGASRSPVPPSRPGDRAQGSACRPAHRRPASRPGWSGRHAPPAPARCPGPERLGAKFGPAARAPIAAAKAFLTGLNCSAAPRARPSAAHGRSRLAAHLHVIAGLGPLHRSLRTKHRRIGAGGRRPA